VSVPAAHDRRAASPTFLRATGSASPFSSPIAALLGWFLAAVLPADTIDNVLRDRPRWVRELIGGCWSVLIAGLGYFLIFPSWVTCLLLAVITQLVYLAAAPLIDRWESALHKGD
jgi:hypothetical protein